MPIHEHKPISEEAMQWISPENTICNTLREIFNSIENEDARLKLRIATSMAKSMSAKLAEYNRNWRSGFWEENEKFPVNYQRKPIDVLFLCWDDNANTMYRFWQCAKYLGLNSVMFKGKPHAFGYPQQAPIHPSLTGRPISMSPTTIPAPGIESLIDSAHVIHLGASTYPLAAINWKNKNVVVQHGGTVYRQQPDLCNAVFNQIAKTSIIQCPDLLGLGSINEQWIYYPVDTAKLKPDFSPKGDVPVIGHFPSNAKVKGTETIERVLSDLAHDGLKFVYVGSSERVPWAENLKRMSQCDIIIEGCNESQDGKRYGEWGNTALEAAALGCAVITHCLSWDKYSEEFGDFGPYKANSAIELESAIRHILSGDNIQKTKRRCRKWVEKSHSIPVTANRLWDLVYKDYFS